MTKNTGNRAGTSASSNWKLRIIAVAAMTTTITPIRPKMTIFEMLITLSPQTLILSGSLKKVAVSAM